MTKTIKLKDNTYWDTKGIMHNKKLLNDILYPVGSIYMSVNNTNPSTLFGGTWEQITGRFLYCTNTSKTTGGNSTVNISHNHGLSNGYARIGCQSGVMYYNRKYGTIIPYNQTITKNSFNPDHVDNGDKTGVATSLDGTTDNGGNTSISILPPYFTVYCWYRTK